eukprot:CAMPEP_0202706478 /NCGR_PEP_ID=MMETSP1385-20130828/18898_1 /ASSEMBLY_ACC=CAM_ASM_000861 /TAXON_ID=933848 /ORGANISM="Elphidium margaritaceum" /LENGTH=187 /DNA_ID=CAMNT_0049364955 /DNA_START=98 /DNA_END=658 /DNA_ORIENTATION=+
MRMSKCYLAPEFKEPLSHEQLCVIRHSLAYIAYSIVIADAEESILLQFDPVFIHRAIYSIRTYTKKMPLATPEDIIVHLAKQKHGEVQRFAPSLMDVFGDMMIAVAKCDDYTLPAIDAFGNECLQKYFKPHMVPHQHIVTPSPSQSSSVSSSSNCKSRWAQYMPDAGAIAETSKSSTKQQHRRKRNR